MPVYIELPEADITCLDDSADMMGAAKKRAEAAGIKNVSFPQGDVGSLPFETEDSLRERLTGIYEEVSVSSVEGMGCFRCGK